MTHIAATRGALNEPNALYESSDSLRNERCAGIIPVHICSSGAVRVMLVKQTNGVLAFPKGHVERRYGHSETLHDAAARELREETGLRVSEWLDAPSEGLIYDYSFTSVPRRTPAHSVLVHKTVHLFPAFVSGSLALSRREIAGVLWCAVEDAMVALSNQPGLQEQLRRAWQSARAHVPSQFYF